MRCVFGKEDGKRGLEDKLFVGWELWGEGVEVGGFVLGVLGGDGWLVGD